MTTMKPKHRKCAPTVSNAPKYELTFFSYGVDTLRNIFKSSPAEWFGMSVT